MNIITKRPEHWRKSTSLKSVDIQSKEWTDKVHGNTYFSAVVTITNNKGTEYTLLFPFQYGYGDHVIDVVGKELNTLDITDKDLMYYNHRKALSLIHSREEGCKKSVVVNWGKE